MNLKNKETDSGSYVNGVYTTKNGHSGSGLGCPKGTRLYSTESHPAVFFVPEDTPPGEEFRVITDEVAPDIMPYYYAVSNYGRVMNIRSGKVMKENYRPNGYGYFCLASDTERGQKKYSSHRMVLATFDPIEGMEDLQVNHIDGDKTHNYINKVMEDGTIDTNLEWNTPSENDLHRDNELHADEKLYRLNTDEVNEIRRLHDEGYTYKYIQNRFSQVSIPTIQAVARNKLYTDPNYVSKPMQYRYNNPETSDTDYFKLTDMDAAKIRQLYANGMNAKAIWRDYFPNAGYTTVLSVVQGKTHSNEEALSVKLPEIPENQNS